jgi:hypothetical protein
MYACAPPPPHRIARLLPKTRLKNTRAWTVKENMLYSVGVCVLDISLVIAAWGRGLMCACVPPPPRRIALRSPKTHAKNADWGPRTPPHLASASPPPAPNQ